MTQRIAHPTFLSGSRDSSTDFSLSFPPRTSAPSAVKNPDPRGAPLDALRTELMTGRSGQAVRKAPRRPPIGPSSQLPHPQPDTIVSLRTWNKMRQNGALFGCFRPLNDPCICDKHKPDKQLRVWQFLDKACTCAPLARQVILHASPHNIPPTNYLRRASISGAFAVQIGVSPARPAAVACVSTRR
jgi:hypothetical protein